MSQITFNVPAECEPYIHDIRRFVDAMMYKLKKNAYKGRWEEKTVEQAVMRIQGELEELEGALKDGNSVEAILECADVANFAMIVASIITERGNAGGIRGEAELRTKVGPDPDYTETDGRGPLIPRRTDSAEAGPEILGDSRLDAVVCSDPICAPT